MAGVSYESYGCVSPASSEENCFEDEKLGYVMSELTLSRALSRELENFCLINGEDDWDRRFHREDISTFSVQNKLVLPMGRYVKRVMRYMSCSRSAYVVAYIYLHRLMAYQAKMRIQTNNCRNLFLTAVVLAAKYVDDRVYTNAYYAKLGGLPSYEELNHLEAEFLRLIHFDLAVNPEDFQTMERYLTEVGSLFEH